MTDDLLNEEMESFLTIDKTIYTVGKEKSKLEINGTQESSSQSPTSHSGLPKRLLVPLYFRRGNKG